MGADEIMIAGGGEIYAQTLSPRRPPLAHRGRRSRPRATRSFPPIDPALWREVRREPGVRGPKDEADFAFVDYERAT